MPETTRERIERRLGEEGIRTNQHVAIARVMAEEIERLSTRRHIHHNQNAQHTRGPVEPEPAVEALRDS